MSYNISICGNKNESNLVIESAHGLISESSNPSPDLLENVSDNSETGMQHVGGEAGGTVKMAVKPPYGTATVVNGPWTRAEAIELLQLGAHALAYEQTQNGYIMGCEYDGAESNGDGTFNLVSCFSIWESAAYNQTFSNAILGGVFPLIIAGWATFSTQDTLTGAELQALKDSLTEEQLAAMYLTPGPIPSIPDIVLTDIFRILKAQGGPMVGFQKMIVAGLGVPIVAGIAAATFDPTIANRWYSPGEHLVIQKKSNVSEHDVTALTAFVKDSPPNSEGKWFLAHNPNVMGADMMPSGIQELYLAQWGTSPSPHPLFPSDVTVNASVVPNYIGDDDAPTLIANFLDAL